MAVRWAEFSVTNGGRERLKPTTWHEPCERMKQKLARTDYLITALMTCFARKVLDTFHTEVARYKAAGIRASLDQKAASAPGHQVRYVFCH